MKSLTRISAMAVGSIAFILAACGDTVENINQMGMDVVASEDDLPNCTSSNEGEMAFVMDAGTAYICVAGDWEPSVSGESAEFSCKTVELEDKSGLKIVCNGDSIGVVLNGEKGESGKDGNDGASGSGCSITDRNDTAVVVVCGDSTMTISLGVGQSGDSLEGDLDREPISLDSLVGYTQKGPFLKGSTVYMYELSDGRTLKPNGNFTSLITRDDGRYKFLACDLMSQYAMVVVDGYYRNEVTGEASNSTIRLRALTDMRERSSVNVNLLTHMEYDRVYYLVTRGDQDGKKLTVKQAKRQAQGEIMAQFHIDIAGTSGSSEDLDVFGATDADAALLAISILAQRDSNEIALSMLLTEILSDMETDGTWEDSAKRAEIADWAMMADSAGKLATYRSNVKDWGFSTTVPFFEKFIRKFASIENGLGVCGSDSTPEGTVKQVSNKNSKKYYAATYTDASNKIRFICVDADSAKWRVATDIEKDTYGEMCVADSLGKVLSGAVNSTNKYYCSENGWVILKGGWNWDVPKEVRLNSAITYGSMTDPRDKKVYKTIKIGDQTWMAENLNYADSTKTPSLLERSWCYNDVAANCDVAGRLYTWAAAIDSMKLAADADNPQNCGLGKTCTLPAKVQGICPDDWHLPTKNEWQTLFTEVGGQSTAGKILKSQTGWYNNGDGMDAFGFSALPAGRRTNSGDYDFEGSRAYFWSATEYDGYYVSGMYLSYDDADAGMYLNYKGLGFPVRCLQDN